LPNADVPSVKRQLEEILAIPAEEAIEASAKMESGSTKFWKRSCTDSGAGETEGRNIACAGVRFRLRRLSRRYRTRPGGIGKNGTRSGDQDMSNDGRYEIKEVGIFTPKMFTQQRLQAGDVRLFYRQHQNDRRHENRRHDHDQRNPAREPLPDFKKFTQWCSAGFIRSTPATLSI